MSETTESLFVAIQERIEKLSGEITEDTLSSLFDMLIDAFGESPYSEVIAEVNKTLPKGTPVPNEDIYKVIVLACTTIFCKIFLCKQKVPLAVCKTVGALSALAANVSSGRPAKDDGESEENVEKKAEKKVEEKDESDSKRKREDEKENGKEKAERKENDLPAALIDA